MISVGNNRKHCVICGQEQKFSFAAIALLIYKFDVFFCQNCGFLQVHNPVWLVEAYSDAIASCDTGLVARNLSLAARLRPLLFYLFGNDGCYADYAGGTGLFVRLMRDAGYDFFWKDPYCNNIHARGFEFKNGVKCRAVTAFEVLEHLVEPVEFITNIFQETGAEVLIFTTELFFGAPPKPDEWWYYSFETGQHISFYQIKTLEMLAERLNLEFYSFNGVHFFSKASLIDKLKRYHGSSLVRQLVRYKSLRMLKPKTMPDHLYLRDM